MWKWKSLSCVRICDPMSCSVPGSSAHGILLARILEWIAISISRGSFWPKDQTQLPCIVDRFFPSLIHLQIFSPIPWVAFFSLLKFSVCCVLKCTKSLILMNLVYFVFSFHVHAFGVPSKKSSPESWTFSHFLSFFLFLKSEVFMCVDFNIPLFDFRFSMSLTLF